MIALCSIGVVCTILAFLLDLHGPSVRVLKSVQRHAVFSMCTGKLSYEEEITCVLLVVVMFVCEIRGTIS